MAVTSDGPFMVLEGIRLCRWPLELSQLLHKWLGDLGPELDVVQHVERQYILFLPPFKVLSLNYLLPQAELGSSGARKRIPSSRGQIKESQNSPGKGFRGLPVLMRGCRGLDHKT